MVIGKISSLATTIFVFALGFIFLRQAFSTSIGASGQDVGAGLTATSMGISSLFNSVISPITGLITTFTSFFNLLSPNGSRSEPSLTGRDERETPIQKVKSSDVVQNKSRSATTQTTGGTYTGGGYVSAVGVASYLK